MNSRWIVPVLSIILALFLFIALTSNEVQGADPVELCVSANRKHTVDIVSYAPADIICSDASGNWQILFDASDAGITGDTDLHAFTILADGTILVLFDEAVELPDAGTVTPWDIARFVPAQLGPETNGIFEFYFDGSDVGLAASSERIDALHGQDGQLYISTNGNFSVPQGSGVLTGADEDILQFSHDSLGRDTSGTWDMFLDGSMAEPRLTNEDIQSLWLDEALQPFFSLTNDFRCSGTPVNQQDILTYDNPGCRLFWRGGDFGFKSAVDGLHIGPPPASETTGITGIVTDQISGVPVDGVAIELYYLNPYYFYWESARWTATAEDGSYGQYYLDPGVYRICFSKPDYVAVCYVSAPDLDGASDILVVAGQIVSGINVQLVPMGGISGTVTNEVTGSELHDIPITIYRYNTKYHY